jgi:hypothetical protein
VSTTEQTQPVTTTGHQRVSVGDQRLGVIHQGSRYVFGFAATYYGIWDDSAPGEPVERFPATAAGRSDAWRRFEELDPAAAEVDPVSIGFPAPAVAEQRRSRRVALVTGTLAAVVVIAVVAVVASKSGKKPAASSGGHATGTGHQAQVTLSGAASSSETLDQQSFKANGVGISLYPEIKATWASSATTVAFDINLPQVGDNVTGQSTKNSVKITSNGTTYTSTNGECTITLKDFSSTGMSGSFDCTGVPSPAGGTATLDAKGTFGASS